MAINAQKLLPPAKLSTAERMAAAYDKKIDDLLNLKIKKKLINVEKITNKTKKTKQVTQKKKKIREENEARKKKEERQEKKQTEEPTKIQLPSLPKTGLLDSVQNFLTYTFLGYMFTNYSDQMSPLAQVVKILPPALDTFGTLIKGTVDVAGGVIEGGYKFKDDLSKKIKDLGGKDAQNTFDTFTTNFKDMINRIMTLGIYQPPTLQKVNGGLVTKMATGGVARANRPVGGPVSREIQTVKAKKAPVVFKQKTEPGKDIGGTEKIQKIFPKSPDIQKPGPLNTLMTTSEELKKIPFIGSLMSAAVDIAMGQRPDRRVYQSFGQAISHLVGPTIENQSSASINSLTNAIIKMASGGPVPLNRQISSNTSSTDRLAIEIAKMFQVNIEARMGRIFSEILKTSPASSFSSSEVPAAELTDDDRKASNELIEYFSKLYGKPAAIGIVANLMRESGLRTYAPEGGFHGMAQWDDGRWSKLTAWARSKGKDPMSRATQAEYIALELNQSGTGARLKSTKTPEEAASIFYNEFERGAYSKPVVGKDAYTPDNPHEQKNRSFVSALAGASYQYVAPGKVKPVITTQFGAREALRGFRPHGGTDLAVPQGTPLRAVSDGTVIKSDYEAGWGNYLVFKDSNGNYHLYGHMQDKVKTGSVKKGDVIGLVGMTGRTTGPHLHWEYGTGWDGTITGKSDPLKHFSVNAPFNTPRTEQPTKKIKLQPQASTSTEPQSVDIASAKPKILNAANQVAMLPSYDQPETILLLQEKIILKESGGQENSSYSGLSNISFPGLNSTSPTFIG